MLVPKLPKLDRHRNKSGLQYTLQGNQFVVFFFCCYTLIYVVTMAKKYDRDVILDIHILSRDMDV